MDISQEMLPTLNDYPGLLKNVITSDKSRVYGYDIETKAQSSRFVTIREIKEKSKQELLAIQKSACRNCLVELKKKS